MYIFDSGNAGDDSFIDGSSSKASKKTGEQVHQKQLSILKGAEFNFPKRYPKTLGKALLQAAETDRSIVFIDDRGEERSLPYHQLKADALNILSSLQAKDVEPGRPVILQLDDLEEFLTAFWACILGGLVPVPVLPFRNANADDSSFRKLQTISSELDRPVILMSQHNADAIDQAVQQEALSKKTFADAVITTFRSLVKYADNNDIPAVIHASRTHDLAFLQYTSGSTSFPKGTQITHANVLATVQSMILALEIDESTVMLNWMPYYHDMGIIAGHIMAVVSACRVIAMRPFTFVRRPIWWLEKIAEHRVTVTYSPNFGLKRIIEKCAPKQLTHLDLSCLKVILNGAEPISIHTSQRFLELLHTHCGMSKECLVPGYGLAEASLAVSIAPIDEVMRTHVLNRDKLGCGDAVEHVHAEDENAAFFADEGAAVAGMDIRVVGDDGKVLPVDTVGHVQIRGRSVTAGYYSNDVANRDSFEGKWFRTGDLGFIYDDRFIITGRVKDVIFVNGQNYYSHDFEHACEDIDGLDRLVVIGHYDDERNEEDLLAFVACNSKFIGAREKTGILRATQMRINQCFDVTPTMFIMLKSTGEIPKTTSGKIMRHKLLENYIDGNFSNQCIHVSELLEIAPDLSTETDSGKHVTISEFKLLIRNWWSEVLGISENAIGDHDPFYSLGGTSIKAIEVLALAEESVDCVITHDMFQEYDTIHALANFIVRENVTVRCKANKLVKLAPYREDLRTFDDATDAVKLDQADEVIAEHKSDAVVDQVAQTEVEIDEDDIAIIGMGCQFPQADNIDEYWQILREGRDCITEFPADRANINKFYTQQSGVENTTVSKWGSFVDSHHFDPKFFSIGENEALTMDPHQRIFLTAAWQAIQDSGLTDINGSRMGVVVGVGGSGIYQQQEDALMTPSTLTGLLGNIVSSRVSNAFNLKGPSLVVDTACSSSLVSVDMAVKSILNDECDTAVAGGVQVLENVAMYLLFSSAGILSPQGRCFTFDERANGFVPGEGAGAVVLKRYSQAVQDGDRVYAVIKASATNNDGASLGIMAPNPEGQEAIISTVLKQGDIDPNDIGYVEAHGTGTNIGDLIEVRGLTLAFGENHKVPNQSCAIGSVKTNMGHQLAAAGIAGLMKAALTVYHREIPASLNCVDERKDLNLTDTPFYINHKTQPWPDNGKRRLAAINSFGFGGTNAHMIIASAEHADIKYPTVTADDEPMVYCFSAKTDLSLDSAKAVFSAYAADSDKAARDIAFTYAAKRDHYRQNRAAIVADSLTAAAAIAKGERVKDASIYQRNHMSPAKSRVAWMFSGQGSQYPAMGKTLYRNEPVFREVINRCDEIASPLLGRSLRDLLLSSDRLDVVSSTEITQPLVFTMDYALAQLWQSWGVQPNYMLGHSIGEYVAATLADVFTLDDALKVVVKRGELMASLPSGCGMTAVMSAAGELLKRVEEMGLPLDPAAYNGPTSTVVSGELSALSELHESLDKDKVLYQPLSVSHAFHSRHMQPILEEFRQFTAGVMMRMPSRSIVSNVTGELIEAGAIDSDYWLDYWADHIRKPVQFLDSIQALTSLGTAVFMEVGAQEHLTGLTRRIIEDKKSLIVSSTPKCVEGMRVDRHIANTKAALYVNGVDIDWKQYYDNHGDRRIVSVVREGETDRRNSTDVAAASSKLVAAPTYALEKRSMFRMVGLNKYPYAELFRSTGESTFEYVADAGSELFTDHVISGMPMLSGAGQCDLISHLFAQVNKLPAKTLRNLSFHQPWLPGLQLNVSFQGEIEKAFTVSNARGHAVFKGIASELTAGEVVPSVSIPALEQQMSHHFSQQQIYDIFDNCGVVYGPFHRNIVELKASTTQALARLKPDNDNEANWRFGFNLHPGILDSAFQAAAGIMLAAMKEAGQGEHLPTLVPLGIEAINNYKCLQESEYYSHVVLHDGSVIDVGNADNDMVCCDITVYDLNGDPCVSVSKLMLKRLPAMKAAVKPASDQHLSSQTAAATAQPPVSTVSDTVAEFFQMHPVRSPLPPSRPVSSTSLIFGSSDAVELQLAPLMAESGVNTLLVPFEHYRSLDEAGLREALGRVEHVDHIIYLGDYAASMDADEAADIASMRCLFHLLRAISSVARANRSLKKAQFLRVVQHALPGVGEAQSCDLRKSVATGFLRSARMEFPLLNLRQLYFAEQDHAAVADKLVSELRASDTAPESYHSVDSRFDLAVSPVEVREKYRREDVFNKEKVFWIIGGTSGVGQLTARHLAENYQSSLILSGSRKLPSVDEYDNYIEHNDDAISATIRFIRELEAAGSRVTYVTTDIRSIDSQRLSLQVIRDEYDHIDGVYFSALQLNDKMILQREWPEYRNMIDMRVNGLYALIEQLQQDRLDFFITYSSLASITGNLGQSDYSASNEYMDTIPYVFDNDDGCRFISVQWGAWALGQQVSDVVLEHMKRSGFIHIEAAAGMQALEKIILSGEKNLAYVPGSLNAGGVAQSINNLRIGLGAKPKPAAHQSAVNQSAISNAVAHQTTASRSDIPEREEEVTMKTNQQNTIVTSDSQMQMLMHEFERQREMFMKLCENQNALLSGSFDGLTDGATVSSTAPQQSPMPAAVQAVTPQSVATESVAPETLTPQPVSTQSAAPQPVAPQPVVEDTSTEQSILQQMSEPETASGVVTETPEQQSATETSTVSASGSGERPADLYGYIASLMANVLEMHVDDIDPDQNIMEFGADSMTALSLVKEVETTYSLELPATLLFEYSTLNELVDYLKSEIGE